MKNKLAVLMLLILVLSTIPIALRIEHVYASPSGPSLIVDDALNQIHETLGATAGSAITVKGTATNVGGSPPAPWLTGVFFRENVGPGITPPDLTLLWSPDGINWLPAGPIWCPTLYPFGFQLELIIGAPNYYLPPGFSSTTYIKAIVNRPAGIGPTDVEVIVFEDWDLSQSYTPGVDVIISVGDMPVKIDLSIWNTAELDPAIFFSTIQAAINAASSGQTIYVYGGIYKENLVVNKALTLQAASSPVIDGGAAGNCISISANNVVITGFEIRNGYNGISGQTSGSTFSNNIIHDNLNIPGSAGVGILLWGDNDNNIITGNEIYNNDRQGIFIGYYDTTKISTGNIISYNTIYNNGLYRYANGPDASEYGIQLWTADNNIIEHNEIYDHDDWFPYGGTFDFAQAIYLCDSDSNLVTHNYLHDNNYGVGLWHPSRPVVTNYINYNNIVENTGYGVCTFDGPPAVDARFDWWGDASGPTHSSNTGGTGDSISDNVDYSPWLGATFATTPRTYHVNPTGAPGAIQEAINEASPDDTIIVHEGTYYENLIVPRSLTIQGVDKETVVLQAQPVGYGDKAIEILASDVTISGFTISGYAATETKPGSTYWGVYAYGSSSSRYSNIVITNNIFTFLGQGGIRLGYVDASLIADDVFKRERRLVWYDPPGPTPGSYIEVTRGGAGPELWYCTNVIIDPNVIQTTGVGIFLYSSSDILIEANTISAPDTVNPSDMGIHVQSCTDIDIIGNTILNFTAGPKSGYTCGTTGAGINILASKAINISLNNLRNNTVGVLVQRLDLTTEPREIDIHYNNLEHNTEFGVLNCYTWIGKDKTYTPTNANYTVNARYNWWGHETGPYHATSWTYMGAPYGPHYGSGDNVSDYVLYDPWLKTPFVPPLVHDVAITQVVPSSTSIIVGTTINIKVNTKNEGTAYENFTVTLSYDGTNIGTADITDLAPSKEKLLTFNWDTTGVTPNQDYTITATASTVPGETDFADNVKTTTVWIGTPPTIKVEPPSYTAKFINETFSVNITMNDLNIGWKAVAVQVGIPYNTSLVKLVSVVEGPFLKKYGDTFFLTSVGRHYIYGDHVLVGIILLPNATGQWSTFPSGSGVLATITFKVISQLRGYDKYQGYITPIPEFNFTLHLTKIMSPGWIKVPHNVESGHCEILPTNIADINYDGTVDIADIYSIALGFGESPSRPRWDPELDVNHDDIIDIEDIYIAALNYGWTQDC